MTTSMFGKSLSECFIGVTSWNSAPFLGPCLDHLRETTGGRGRIVVLDNGSVDGSADVARKRGAEVVVRKCSQPDALNALLSMSRSRYTLLMHSDVIMLHPQWLELCVSRMLGSIALISPEDIGCGPYTRSWGTGMPESSFLFFDTVKAMASRKIFWRQRFKIRWPFRALDFNSNHVTYNIPGALEARGYSWEMMQVHASKEETEEFYTPKFVPKYWGTNFGKLRYGMGNFYSLDGQITHYHNWYDRVGLGSGDFDPDSTDTVPPDGGIPKAYLQLCSRRFLDDLASGSLQLPAVRPLK